MDMICKRNMKFKSLINSQGFTLAELMIGLVINLFIIGVAFTYFISSSQTYKIQSSDGRLQENARLVFQIITTNLRNSGYCDKGDTFCDSQPINTIFSGASVCSDDDVTAGAGVSTCLADIPRAAGPPAFEASDRIALSFSDDSITSVCGLATPAGDVYHVITFWAAPGGTDNASALWCQVSTIDPDVAAPAAENKVALIDGVETIQFEYGVDTNADGTADRYMNATTWNALLAGGLVFSSDIKTVKIAVLVSSGLTEAREINLESDETKTYTVLDSSLTFDQGADRSRELKQIFSTTIGLKN